jgi:tRNA threonylcarbamoyladenosine biosynthesis protein TsaB
VLAVDVSTWWGGAALVERSHERAEPETVAEIGLWVRDSHAEHLLVWIDLLLREAGWPRTCLDAYAATRGPGSFTGIRVGLGTVQGLAIATGRPCHGVVTLEALAEAAGPASGERLCLMDAGRGELYGARYDGRSSPPRALEEPWLRPASSAFDGARDGGVAIPAPGTDLSPLPLPEGASHTPSPRGIAAAVGRLVARQAEGALPAPLTPLYIRPPDAILKRRSS